jgi:hypothetical protein
VPKSPLLAAVLAFGDVVEVLLILRADAIEAIP